MDRSLHLARISADSRKHCRSTEVRLDGSDCRTRVKISTHSPSLTTRKFLQSETTNFCCCSFPPPNTWHKHVLWGNHSFIFMTSNRTVRVNMRNPEGCTVDSILILKFTFVDTKFTERAMGFFLERRLNK